MRNEIIKKMIEAAKANPDTNFTSVDGANTVIEDGQDICFNFDGEELIGVNGKNCRTLIGEMNIFRLINRGGELMAKTWINGKLI